MLFGHDMVGNRAADVAVCRLDAGVPQHRPQSVRQRPDVNLWTIVLFDAKARGAQRSNTIGVVSREVGEEGIRSGVKVHAARYSVGNGDSSAREKKLPRPATAFVMLGLGNAVRAHGDDPATYHQDVIRTRFTEMFGLQHPIINAPMAMHSGVTLAAAVAASGAMGSFSGHAAEGPDWVSAQAALVRDQTDRPFAIGFITPFLPFSEGHFQAALDARPEAIALSFSNPGDWGRRVQDAGLRLICQAQSFEDADLAVEAGAEVLVAQGTEAGGHTGTMSLLPLLVGIAERHPNVTLLAAGGISSGRSLAAALLAGADGAWLGTVFLATPEAIEIDDHYKAAIVASDGGDTVFTRAYDIASRLPWPAAIGARMRRDAFTEEWAEHEADLRRRSDGVAPGHPLYMGQSAGSVDAVRPAAEVVRLISSDAERVLRERPLALVPR